MLENLKRSIVKFVFKNHVHEWDYDIEKSKGTVKYTRSCYCGTSQRLTVYTFLNKVYVNVSDMPGYDLGWITPKDWE